MRDGCCNSAVETFLMSDHTNIMFYFLLISQFEKVFRRLDPDRIASLLVPGLRPTATAIARDLDTGGGNGGNRGGLGGGLSAEWLLLTGVRLGCGDHPIASS